MIILKKSDVYLAKIIGYSKEQQHKVQIISILERTVVVNLIDEENKTALAKICDIAELR